MAIRPFKLELTKTNNNGIREVVSFGPRSFGDVGRDIMIVKKALGQLIPYSELIDPAADNPPGLEDPDGWFDCVTAEKVTDRQAATFDAGMQRYLIKYQLDNQFYIFCYNFNKFNIAQQLEARKDFENREKENIFQAAYNNIKSDDRSFGFDTEFVDNIDDDDEKFFITLQLNVMLEMFERELGELGEATLAVMHGWRPRSSVGNKTYYHPEEVFGPADAFDSEGVADLVLLGLFDALISENLSQTFVSLDEPEFGVLLEPTLDDIIQADRGRALERFRENGDKAVEILDLYNRQVSAFEDAQIDNPEYNFKSIHFGAMRYSVVPIDYESVLYSAFKSATDLDTRDPSIPSSGSSDYSSVVRRAFEPDPLTDPDPFVIDSKQIGFFDITNYTLGNIPPDPNSAEYRSIISDMEDRALTKVLDFYSKPSIWFIDPDDPVFQGYYGTNRNPRMLPRHNGEYTSPQEYCITTRTHAQRIGRFGADLPNFFTLYNRNDQGDLSEGLDNHTIGAFEHYEIIEYENYEQNVIYNTSEEPLVQFVEFRTPSLRPGDFYRAKFLINRRKLEQITRGVYHQQADNQEQNEDELSYPVPQEAEQLSPTCDDSPPSLEQQQRRYEEYKALAAKRKKEIARALRESALDSYRNEALAGAARIDLGVFGNSNFDFFGGLKTDSPEFRNMLAEKLGSFIGLGTNNDAEGVQGPSFGGSNGKPLSLVINYQDLKTLSKKAGDNLKKAYENCLKDQVSFKGISNYNGALEAARLQELPEDIKNLISATPNVNKNYNPGETETGMTLTGFADVINPFSGGASSIRIEFGPSPGSGAKIKKIVVEGTNIDLKNIKPGTSLSRPRTVGYLAQLKEISGGTWFDQFLGDSTGTCDEFGLGQKGLAFLVKHTMGLSGAINDEFNPLSQWWTQNFETPAKAWANRNGENLDNMFSYDQKYGTDALLTSFGNNCKSLKLFFRELFDKASITQILCDLLKCLKLPAINFTVPNFRIPDLPKLPIFGWWQWLIQFMVEKFIELAVRFLCAYARFILDLLKAPFCKDQLTDELFGTASMGTPGVKAALADGLLQLDIRLEEKEKAEQLIDEMGIFLTGDELCRILQGEPLDDASTNMILKIANRLGIESLNNEDTLRDFFETISLFIPEGFCEGLRQATFVTGRSSCLETADYTGQIRRRMLANEATDDEINRAVEMANANLMDEVAALEALGEQGISAIIPKAYEFGNSEAVMSDIPGNLKKSANRTGKQIFESVKTSYLTSLTTYRSSFFMNSNSMPKPDQARYSENSAIIVETILENLKLFNSYSEQTAGQISEAKLHRQLYLLHQVYELEKYHTPFDGYQRRVAKVYRSRGFDLLPQTSIEENPDLRFSPVPYDERSEGSESEIATKYFLNPIGYMLNGYYFSDEAGNPKDYETFKNDRDDDDDDRDDPSLQALSFVDLGTIDRFLNSNKSPLRDHPSVGIYKLLKKAIAEQRENRDPDNPEDIDLSADDITEMESIKLLQQLVNDRLRVIQQDLIREMEYLATPETSEQFLMNFKEQFDAATENMREQTAERQAVDARPDQGAGFDEIHFNASLGFAQPRVVLREFPSQGGSVSNVYDPYTVEVNATSNNTPAPSSLLGETTVFSYCDTLPGPGLNQETATPQEIIESERIHQAAIRDVPAGLYTRREVMSRIFWGNVYQRVLSVFDQEWEGPPHRSEIAVLSEASLPAGRDSILRQNFYDIQFLDFKEGIFEQILFSLRQSRLFDEAYFDRYIRKVMGKTTVERDGCFRNIYNISSFGALSFEKIVTDEFEEQLQAEMARPENRPENLDFDDLGPFEKAIQNVSIVGFVRLCIVEFIIKGALPFSVWDIQGVADDPLIKDYLYHFVAQEIERYPSANKHWKKIVARVMGIDHAPTALKRMVEQQFLKFVGTSQTIFENSESVDYYNWFVKYGIPQTEVSRKYVVRRPNAYQRIPTGDAGFEILRLQQEDGDSPDEEGVVRIDAVGLDDIEEFFGDDINENNEIVRPGDFYWSHPLEENENIILRTEEFSDLLRQDKESIRAATLGGSNNFFHIEHCIELRGPLARLESIVLPVREIVEEIINLQNDDINPENERYMTEVEEQYRTPQRLNVIQARNRLSPVGDVEIEDYRIRQRVQLPEGAAGSSLETDSTEANNYGDYNSEHEIMHIEDFIDGIRNALSAEDLERYFYHLQMRLHYSEESDSGPEFLNTDVEEAHGYHEVIKRTPTKFIVRKRRYINFSRDYILNDIDDYLESGARRALVSSYKNDLYNHSVGPTKLLARSADEQDNELSRDYYNKFSTYMRYERHDPHRYYVITSNGEEILKLSKYLEDNPSEIDQNGFASILQNPEILSYVDTQNKLISSIENGSQIKKFAISENGYRPLEVGELFNPFEDIRPRDDGRHREGGRRGVEKLYSRGFMVEDIPCFAGDKDLAAVTKETEISTQEPIMADELTHRRTEDPQEEAPTVIFKNYYGDFGEDEEKYNQAIRALRVDPENSPNAIPRALIEEEVHLETVFSFTGYGSLICGLKGSYNIPETKDQKIAEFKLSGDTRMLFEGALKNVLGDLGYKYEAADDSYFEIENMKDQKLAQYGRIFYKLANDRGSIRLGRPMGIDPHTNSYLTTKILCRNNWSEYWNMTNRRDDWQLPILDPNGPDGISRIRVPRATKPNYGENDFFTGDWAIPRSDVNTIGAAVGNRDSNRTKLTAIRHSAVNSTIDEVSKNIFLRPTISGAGENLKISYTKGSVLAPNVYKVPIRMVLTQVYKNDELLPREVYCKVIPPRHFDHRAPDPSMPDNLKKEKIERGSFTNQMLVFDEIVESLPGFEGADGDASVTLLNQAIFKIANEYIEFVKSASNTVTANFNDIEVEEGKEVLSIDTIREKISDFPDFTTDFGKDSHALGNKFKVKQVRDGLQGNNPENWNFPNLKLESNRQYCSIERIYSEAFLQETRQEFFNTKEEIDEILRYDRGKLLKNTGDINFDNITGKGRKGHLQSKTLFYQQTRWDLAPSGGQFSVDTDNPLRFHQTSFSLMNLVDNYMNYRSEDSFWGHLVSYSKYQNYAPDQQRSDHHMDVRTGLPFITYYSRISPEWTGGGNQITPKFIAYLRQQPESLSTFARFRDHDDNSAEKLNSYTHIDLTATDAIDTYPEPSYAVFYHAKKKTRALFKSGVPEEDIEDENSLSSDSGNYKRGVEGFNRHFGHKHWFCSNEPGLMLLVPNIADLHEGANEKHRFFRNRSRHNFKKHNSTTFCNFTDLLYAMTRLSPAGDRLETPKFFIDGSGWDLVNYNPTPETLFDTNKNSMFYADGNMSLEDFSILFKSSIKSILLGLLTPEDLVDENGEINEIGLSNLSDPFEYFDYNVFFNNKTNYGLLVNILRGIDEARREDVNLGQFSFDQEQEMIKESFRVLERQQQGEGYNDTIINELVITLENITESLAFHLGMQMSYKTASEVGAASYRSKIEAIISLIATSRILKHIRKNNYSSIQKLILLSMISSVDSFFTTFQIGVASIDAERKRDDQNPEKDWAIACLHFLFMHLARLRPEYLDPDHHAKMWKDYQKERPRFTGFPDGDRNAKARPPWERYWNTNMIFKQVGYKPYNGDDERNDGYQYYLWGSGEDGQAITVPGGMFESNRSENGKQRKDVEQKITFYLASRISEVDREAWYDKVFSVYSYKEVINVANVFRYQYAQFESPAPEKWGGAPGLNPGNYGSLADGIYPDNNSLILQVLREQIIPIDRITSGDDDIQTDLVGIAQDVANRYNDNSFYESAYQKYIQADDIYDDTELIVRTIPSALAIASMQSTMKIYNQSTPGEVDLQSYALNYGHIEPFLSSLDTNLFYNLLITSVNNRNFNPTIRPIPDEPTPPYPYSTPYGNLTDSDQIDVFRAGSLIKGSQSGTYSLGVQNTMRDPAPEVAGENPLLLEFKKTSPFIERYLRNRYGQSTLIEGVTSINDLYRKIIKLSLYGSPSTHGQLTHLTVGSELNTLNRGRNAVEVISRRYGTAIARHTGITEGILNSSALSRAFIDGVLVENLIESSQIDQVCRLVANVFEGSWDCSSEGAEQTVREGISLELFDNDEKSIIREYKTIQNISEEYRSFYMVNNVTGINTFSVPMSRYSLRWSDEGGGFKECLRLPQFRRRYQEHRDYMVSQLLDQDQTKLIFNYLLPVKRYQAVSTIFATDALASYNTMPSVMRTPKATLSGIINIASMNTKQRNELFEDISQSEFFKTMLDDANTNGDGFACFSNPIDSEFFDQFWTTFKELIALFPAIFFRGIADTVDPAYKEMKRHWLACEIKDLTHKGLAGNTLKQNYKDMNAGLYKPPGTENQLAKGLYAPIIPSAPIDFVYSLDLIVKSKFRSGWSELGNTLAKTIGYAYKGPISLVDGLFSFGIPCADYKADEWRSKPFNTGRYGHPYSPLTGLALAMKQLPGDLRTREGSQTCERIIQIPSFPDPTNVCIDEYPPPFGRINDSED